MWLASSQQKCKRAHTSEPLHNTPCRQPSTSGNHKHTSRALCWLGALTHQLGGEVKVILRQHPAQGAIGLGRPAPRAGRRGRRGATRRSGHICEGQEAALKRLPCLICCVKFAAAPCSSTLASLLEQSQVLNSKTGTNFCPSSPIPLTRCSPSVGPRTRRVEVGAVHRLLQKRQAQ